MAIIPDAEIKSLIENQNAISAEEGLNLDLQLGPSSFDLRLGSEFGVLDTRKLDLVDTREMDSYSEYIRKETHDPDEGIIVHPGEFVLGSTLESISVPDDMVARVEGRSSYGRLGIIVHATAGYIDPGFEGDITLEIQNLGNVPVRIYPEDRICQIVFENMTERADRPYGEKSDTKYMGQTGATGSKLEDELR